jgi:polar amino acid transport system permease protein
MEAMLSGGYPNQDQVGRVNIFDIFTKYSAAIGQGLLVTFELAAIVWLAGIVFGVFLGSLAARSPVIFGVPTRACSYALSAMPVLVFLFWLHYPAQVLLHVVIDPFVTAAVTLSVLNIFGVADIVRNVLRDFPRQYVAAAQVCGMSPWHTLVRIELPIVLRQTIPPLLTQQVAMLQATLFASLISVNEIFRVAQQINATEYKPVEIYTGLGLLFLGVCLPINATAIILKSKFTRDYSEA